MTVIGIDLGGTKLAAALIDENGHISQQETSLLQKRQGTEVGGLIKDQIERLLILTRTHHLMISGIGISVPGIYYARIGHVWAPNIPGWDDFPLKPELTAWPDLDGIPVTIDSDRACYILGETWLGAAKGCRNAIFIAVGTGIGAGIMIDGQVLRGAHDIAGAIGWLALDRPFRNEYVGCGCFEYHASGEGIAKVARGLLSDKSYSTSSLQKIPPEELMAHHVFEAYNNSDPLAVRVLDECIEFWGMTVANLVSLFNPEKVIFGGGVFGPATRLLDRIRDEACRWAQPISITQVGIEASTLGGDAGLLGAGNLALRYLKHH
jgi:glucokinase